ncbi:F-box/FBD/LRR-repeat protein At1g13570-like [Lolium perenne]|uniref:F-box/FBD/LRR-repeat protein At1g13570-like n=1 Tax=Lolium perenne TaxID=4522 RepID=UPI0021F51687|nr:F-box/FBD/LRR-repeat protein At1g13570-like [Lolium perenne]
MAAATSSRRRSRDSATASPLESLPPATLDEILSHLPFRDAARTSVLSRAWRRRWETVPYRFLDWPLGMPADAIDHVLAHCAQPVHEFRHPHVPVPDFGRCDHWLLRLAAVGVRFDWSNIIGIDEEVVTFPRIHMLHSCIFSCRQIATLDLVGCDIPAPPPCFVRLPSLTTLTLSKVGFPQGVKGLEALISLRTLQLEELSIPAVQVDGGRVYEQWVINAPNLQRLHIISMYYYGWHFSGLPFLEVADMSGLGSRYHVNDRDFLNLISGLDQARELKLSIPFTWNNALKGLPPSFENLKCLSLQTQLPFPASIFNILCVVKNAPKLEVLEIELMVYVNTLMEVGIDFLYGQCAADLFSNLTNVRMKGVICERNEMLFIELVLSKARQLEAFDVCLSRDCSRSVEDALAEVAQYGRASPGANATIRHN